MLRSFARALLPFPLAGLVALGPHVALAEPARFAACAGIVDPARRLACYDAAARVPAASSRDPVAEFGRPPIPAGYVRAPEPLGPAAQPPIPDTISSTIVGTGTDPQTGRLAINLANDQTWVVTGWDRPLLPKLDRPVTISRTFLGNYLITMSDVAYGAARSR